MPFKLKFVSFCQLSIRWRNVVPSRGVTGQPVLLWKWGRGQGVVTFHTFPYKTWQTVHMRNRVTLLAGFGSPSRVNLVKASKPIRACASVVGLVNFFLIEKLAKVDSAGRVPSTRDRLSPYKRVFSCPKRFLKSKCFL